MYLGQLEFAQLMEHFPLHRFRRYVRRYPSKYPTKTFSHLDQFLCIAFSQLTYRESLRDIETCLCAHQTNLAAIVQSRLEENPFSGHLFVFRGRQGDRIKVLWWSDDGATCLPGKLSD